MTTAEKSEQLTTIADLLDALQVERGWKSDNRIAKELQVPQQTVSNWRTGARFPKDESCVQIAQALQVEPSVVLTIVGAARARGTTAESAWRSLRRFAGSSSKRSQELARQIARAVALAALGSGAQLGLFSSPANVAPAELTAEQCILSKIKRIRRKAA